jgi:hypothetical protein
MIKTINLIFVLILLVGFRVGELKATEHETGVWVVGAVSDAFGTDDEPSRWRYMVQGQLRSFSLLDGTRQAVIRGGLGYQASPDVRLWGGYAFYHTHVVHVGSADEHRFWQQVDWTMGRWGWGTLKSRTRMEQRIRENRDGTGWWLRQRFRADIPIKKKEGLNFILAAEAFFHLRDTAWSNEGFSQNRLIVGLGYRVSPGLGIEVGYMNQYYRIRNLPNLMNHLAILSFRF